MVLGIEAMDTVLLPADISYTSEKSESYNTIERGGLYDEIFTRRIYRHI